jgi:predicted transposase/invertase (TIGR01784 family)
MEKGRKEEQRQIAKKMKQKGLDYHTIKEITGISIKEIDNL